VIASLLALTFLVPAQTVHPVTIGGRPCWCVCTVQQISPDVIAMSCALTCRGTDYVFMSGFE
jgi:hypothetical protein